MFESLKIQLFAVKNIIIRKCYVHNALILPILCQGMPLHPDYLSYKLHL